MSSWAADTSWYSSTTTSGRVADPYLVDLEQTTFEGGRSEAWASLVGTPGSAKAAFDPWNPHITSHGGLPDCRLKEFESRHASSESLFTSASGSDDGGSSNAVDQFGDYDRDKRAALDFVLELAGPQKDPPPEVVETPSDAVVAVKDLPLPAFTVDRYADRRSK